MVWTDTRSGDTAHFNIEDGYAKDPVDPPPDFDSWTPCDGAPDRHELQWMLATPDADATSVQMIEFAFDAMDRIITHPERRTEVRVGISPIDGPNNILAQAIPWSIWEDGTTAWGEMELDSFDLNQLDSSVVVHELIHILGFANIPGLPFARLVERDEAGRMVFTGGFATRAWRDMGGEGYPPLYEADGGNHFDEQALAEELMTPFSDGPANVLSALTLGVLMDIGYRVNRAAADRFALGRAQMSDTCERCTLNTVT